MTLEKGDQILFLWKGYHGDEPETVFDGSIVCISDDYVTCVCLYGYKSITEDVKYDKILSKHVVNGEFHQFPGYSGCGELTENGVKYLAAFHEEL